jgi:hypothetical protein
MKKSKYLEAIEWIVLNDLPPADDDGWISVCLVADLFNVKRKKVLADVRDLFEQMKLKKWE